MVLYAVEWHGIWWMNYTICILRPGLRPGALLRFKAGLTRAGFRFTPSHARASGFRLRLSVRPLRGDLRRFAGGVILSCESGLPGPLRGYAPHSRKSGLQYAALSCGFKTFGIFPRACRCGASPPPRHPFRVHPITGFDEYFQLYESF